MDLNEFYQSFEKCSILSPDIRKQPQTLEESINHLKGKFKVWQWFTTRGSYVHAPMIHFRGHPENITFPQNNAQDF